MGKNYRKRKRSKLTKHHVIPRSRGGGGLENNIALVPRIPHETYHNLFGNRKPDEIIDYLVQDFWRGDKFWVDKYLTRYK